MTKRAFQLGLLLVVHLGCGRVAVGQTKGYECTYLERTSLSDQFKDMEDSPVKQAIVEALSKQKNFYKLTFCNGKSLFTRDKQQNADVSSSRITFVMGSEDGSVVFTDHVAHRRVTQESFYGRKFLINETTEAKAWTIHNETKTVAGHVCTKATLGDSASEQQVTAWFAQSIPIPSGPAGFDGLPGLICELDMGVLVYTLQDLHVVTNPNTVEEPKKGKKVSREEFVKIQTERLSKMQSELPECASIQVIQP